MKYKDSKTQKYLDALNVLCGYDSTDYKAIENNDVSTLQDCIFENLKMSVFLKINNLEDAFKKHCSEYEYFTCIESHD